MTHLVVGRSAGPVYQRRPGSSSVRIENREPAIVFTFAGGGLNGASFTRTAEHDGSRPGLGLQYPDPPAFSRRRRGFSVNELFGLVPPARRAAGTTMRPRYHSATISVATAVLGPLLALTL